MRLPGPRRTVGDQVPTLAHELRAEIRAEQLLPQPRLEREVELLDRPQERELRPAGHPLHPRLPPMGDLLAHQRLEVGRIPHSFLLRPHLEIAPETTDRRHVQSPQHPVQLRRHAIPSTFCFSHSSTISAPCHPRSTASWKTVPIRSGPCSSSISNSRWTSQFHVFGRACTSSVRNASADGPTSRRRWRL